MHKRPSSEKVKREERGVKIGPPKLTRFERARIIGARALQLSMAAPPLVQIGDLKDPIKISIKELEARALPISIKRTLPDGMYQDIPVVWLL